MIAIFIMTVIGCVCIILGLLLWKKEKITLLHKYHYEKVSQKDKKMFCKISGIGVLTIGMGLFVSGVMIYITDLIINLIPFAAGFSLGMVLLIYAGIRYNTK